MEAKEYIAGLVAKARAAQAEFEAKFTTQRAVDEVVQCIGKTLFDARNELCAEAIEETKFGIMQGKIAKMFALTFIWDSVKGHKSMGYIENMRDEPGVSVIAKPVGVVGAVMPSTNPIVTIGANGMYVCKCRNAMIVASHPSAKNVSKKAVDMIRANLKAMGAPEDIVQIIEPEMVSLEATSELLKQCDVNIATGGPGMVKAVYSCGKPGFGVGQGNDQCIIGDYDNLAVIAANTVGNRSWDNGVPCTGDQMCHVPAAKEEEFVAAMDAAGAYVIKDEETIQKLRDLIFPNGGRINVKVVGKTPTVVGKMIGLDVPEDKKIFLAKVDACGQEDVLCREILFPFSRYVTYTDFSATIDRAVTNLKMEGAGHSSCIWSNDQAQIDEAAMKMPVSRLHVNQHCQGSGNGLNPTVTLGCGIWSGNSTNENLTWYQFYQMTRVTTVLPNGNKPDFANDWNNFDVWPKTV